jgi:hypothetical protein
VFPALPGWATIFRASGAESRATSHIHKFIATEAPR